MNGGSPVSNSSAPIISIAASYTYSDSVYAATCPGGGANPKIFRTINGGASFTDITGTLPNRYFSYIAVDPRNSKRVAVAVSGFGTSHIYLTSDGGTTWNDIGGSGGTALPDVPANVVMFDPTIATRIFVGNDLGVYYATGITTGTTQPAWYSMNSGLTDATMVMDMLVTSNNKIRLGTYGKGLSEMDMNAIVPIILSSFNVSCSDNGKHKFVSAKQR